MAIVTRPQQTKMIQSSKEPFPYKREFINPDQIWDNAVQIETQIKVIAPTKRWPSLPKNIKWVFQGKNVAVIYPTDVYDKVNILTDYFSEDARMQARRKNCPSPLEYYDANYNRVVYKAQELLQKDQSKPLRFHMREALYELAQECTQFKIYTTKAIFKYLGSKVVLDPSAGWGDRLLGAAAAGVRVYHGVDPNTLLRQPYDNMIKFVNQKGIGENSNYTVVTDDFLKVDIDEEGYDTVFTSPPFFDYEIYSDDPKQSITGNPSVDTWLTNFFYPYLKKAWSALARGGYMVLYISDVPSGKFVNHMFRYVNNELKGNFKGIIGTTSVYLSYGYPLWIWQKHK